MSQIVRIPQYLPNPRPGSPTSFPFYVSDELQKLARVQGQVLAALRELDERLKALEP